MSNPARAGLSNSNKERNRSLAIQTHVFRYFFFPLNLSFVTSPVQRKDLAYKSERGNKFQSELTVCFSTERIKPQNTEIVILLSWLHTHFSSCPKVKAEPLLKIQFMLERTGVLMSKLCFPVPSISLLRKCVTLQNPCIRILNRSVWC